MQDITADVRTWREGRATVEAADYFRAGRYIGSTYRRTYRGRERGWTVRADGCGRVEYWHPDFLCAY